jgi:Spy/CpxP family protein refolding chaperone
MKLTVYLVRAALIGVCATACVSAVAEDGVPPPGGPGFGRPGMEGPHGHGGFGPGRHGWHEGFGMGPDLHLSEAQQDKVFAVMHAAEPQRRDHAKAVRKAHEALHALSEADRFDEVKAAAAANALGDALAASALQEARIHAQLQAILTPEQRQQAAKGHAEHEPRQRPH